MSEVSKAKLSMERCLLDDLPYVILLEIFRGLSKDKLIEIYRLCPKFRNVAGDTRLWKHVYIKYERGSVPFEELYSGPWPVKAIDLSRTEIGNCPVYPQADQVVKVTELDLSGIKANRVTVEAILAKYQCTELNLSFNTYEHDNCHILEIAPEAFSKQTALEVLLLKGVIEKRSYQWLAQVLNYCKNLKTLDLSFMKFSNFHMLDFVKRLPASLEKLCLGFSYLEDSFFQLLAESCPTLRELDASIVKCPSLIDFQLLETLHIIPYATDDVSDLDMYLKKFTALKTVNIIFAEMPERNLHSPNNISVQKLRTTLKSHGIIVGVLEYFPTKSYPKDNNLWMVTSFTELRKALTSCHRFDNFGDMSSSSSQPEFALVHIFAAAFVSSVALYVIFRTCKYFFQ